MVPLFLLACLFEYMFPSALGWCVFDVAYGWPTTDTPAWAKRYLECCPRVHGSVDARCPGTLWQQGGSTSWPGPAEPANEKCPGIAAGSGKDEHLNEKHDVSGRKAGMMSLDVTVGKAGC